MRPFRSLILLLVLATALLVALVRPLPGHASEAATATTKKQTRPSAWRRRHLHHQARVRAERRMGRRVVKYAKRFIGAPYAWGGASPRTGFDCSGLVLYVYKHFGISLPHSSYGDKSHGRRILRHNLRPGDLVFFAGDSHVGIYVGRNRVIDAPHSGAVVHITTMTDWYSYAFSGARRVAHAA